MNRTMAIILTAVTALFCGCPGLFTAFMGAMFAVVSFIPGANIDVGGSSDPTTALMTGLGMCCIGLPLIVIPLAVGFFTLRRASS